MIEFDSEHKKLILGSILFAEHETVFTFSKFAFMLKKNAAHIVEVNL